MSAITVNGISFNGSSYLSRDSDFSGNADSKFLTGSYWFKRDEFGRSQYIYAAENIQVGIAFLGSNDRLSIIGRTTGGTTTFHIQSSPLQDTDWHHCMFSIDPSDSSAVHLYIDDTDDLTIDTLNDLETDFTRTGHGFGARYDEAALAAVSGLSNIYSGCVGGFWLAPGVYIDLSDEDNRRLFYTSDGKPESLGNNGETPSGSAPLIYLYGDPGDFPDNYGTGGAFTVAAGFLENCDTDPYSIPAFVGYGGGVGIGPFKRAEFWGRRARRWGRR